MSNAIPLKILQVLPALNSGGVERGTLDFARYLVANGHDSHVMSSGGRLVSQLQVDGSTHHTFPVHKKSLLSFLNVGLLRQALVSLKPDLIHVRSRMPAWLIWYALKKWPLLNKPVLISTFHGLYSVSFYSAIMGCGDQVIAISECVRDYIIENYPKINPAKVNVIHRGVDTQQFNKAVVVSQEWRNTFQQNYPDAVGKHLILMPGRLSQWKGQEDFIALMSGLLAAGHSVHGLIVGEATPGKSGYEKKLKREVAQRGLNRHISFVGHREDMAQLYKTSTVVVNLSRHAEPFGRTVIESLAIGTPVVAYDSGGPAESLRECLPRGLVAMGDSVGLVERVAEFLTETSDINLPDQFTLDFQAQATVKIYRKALLQCESP